MMMIALTLAITALVGYIGVAVLNAARIRLQRLGLPMTLKNLLFLSAHEVEARDREDAREKLEDEVLWAREIAGPELLAQIEGRVARGETWESAARGVLIHDDADPVDTPAREEARLRLICRRRAQVSR